MMKIRWAVALLGAGAGLSHADPALLSRGYLLAPGQGAAWLRYENWEYSKRFDGAGAASDFPAGETRKRTALRGQLAYGLPGGVELAVESSFLDLAHRLPAGSQLTRTGMGDTLVLVKSLGNPWGDLKGPMGLGVRLPTGRGLFHMDLGNALELPTGEGVWGGVVDFAWSDRRYGGFVFHAGLTYQLSLPFEASSVRGQAAAGTFRVDLGHQFDGGAGMEIPISDSLSLLAEVTGTWRFARGASYTATGQSALADIDALASPEVPLKEMIWIGLTPLLQIRFSHWLTLSGGLSMPLKMVNAFAWPNTQVVWSAVVKFP